MSWSRRPGGSSSWRPGVAADGGNGRRGSGRRDEGLHARTRVRYSGPMNPLAGKSIATVGSGVMAEAMIAGLLRGELVAPDQIVASHPRPERRDHLRGEYGIRVVSDNVTAVDGADVVLLGIKPQMLGKVGREIGPSL